MNIILKQKASLSQCNLGTPQLMAANMGGLSSHTATSIVGSTQDTWLKEQHAWSWVGLFTQCLQLRLFTLIQLWPLEKTNTKKLLSPVITLAAPINLLCNIVHQLSLCHLLQQFHATFVLTSISVLPVAYVSLFLLLDRGWSYVVWLFSRKHLLWWCWLLIISFFSSCFLLSQNLCEGFIKLIITG